MFETEVIDGIIQEEFTRQRMAELNRRLDQSLDDLEQALERRFGPGRPERGEG